MPLPQKVVEQLGREPPKTPGWSSKLLMFSGTIFFVSLSIYFGLDFGYKPYLSGEIQKINDQISQFGQQVSASDQLKLISFYSQLTNIKSLLAHQTIGLRAFDWIQDNTQVNTYIHNLSVTFQSNQISFSASSKTMDDALQQIALFDTKPEVQKSTVGGVSLSGNQWQFSAQLVLTKEYFSRSFTAIATSSTGTGTTP